MKYPIAVPANITAALRDNEVAEHDADTGEWFATGSRRRPLAPLTRADASALRSRVREMSHADHELLDEMRRFYEHRKVAS